jgi:hypothetical protein
MIVNSGDRAEQLAAIVKEKPAALAHERTGKRFASAPKTPLASMAADRPVCQCKRLRLQARGTTSGLTNTIKDLARFLTATCFPQIGPWEALGKRPNVAEE